MSRRNIPGHAETLQFRKDFLPQLNVGQVLCILFDSFEYEEHKLKLQLDAPEGNPVKLSAEQFQQKFTELRAHFFAAITSIQEYSHVTGIIMPNKRILISSGEVVDMKIDENSHVDINRLIGRQKNLEPQQAILFAFPDINLLYEALLYTYEPIPR